MEVWKIQPYFSVTSAINLNPSADSNTSGRLSTKQQDKNQKKPLLTDYCDQEEYCVNEGRYNTLCLIVAKLQHAHPLNYCCSAAICHPFKKIYQATNRNKKMVKFRIEVITGCRRGSNLRVHIQQWRKKPAGQACGLWRVCSGGEKAPLHSVRHATFCR